MDRNDRVMINRIRRTAAGLILAMALLCGCLCMTGCFGGADETVTGDDWKGSTAQEQAEGTREGDADADASADAEAEAEKAGYFYEHLDPGARKFYDAVMEGIENAGDPEFEKTVKFEAEYEEKRDIVDTCAMVRYALESDHPEIFWICSSKVWDDSVHLYSMDDGSAKAVISFTQAPDKAEIAKFEEATKEFLAGIDLTASKDAIARQIHDDLIDLVTYDEDAYEGLVNSGKSTDEEGMTDRAFTAYGALVANSSGQPHRAVCQGYALAYQYLLGRAGIDAMVVSGTADSESGEVLGADSGFGHAWNIVSVDGRWVETDPTWDDYTFDEARMESSAEFRSFVEEVKKDPAYEAVRHCFYGLTTAEMTDYVFGEDCIAHVTGYYPTELRTVGAHATHKRYSTDAEKKTDRLIGELMDTLPEGE